MQHFRLSLGPNLNCSDYIYFVTIHYPQGTQNSTFWLTPDSPHARLPRVAIHNYYNPISNKREIKLETVAE